MTTPSERRPPRKAGADLLVLARTEEFAIWLLARTARWPKRARFTLTQRIEQHALDLVEDLTIARFQREGRGPRLRDADLTLERVRRLLRVARETATCPANSFEYAMRSLDEIGRMLYGWRNPGRGDRDAAHR